ncbi:MAG: lipopolysaccharide biosynthesis protein [Halieaceae bacterium]|nr:lipopolysaccharide biosynthesis protein [Halieaceae bacterium]
MENLNRKMAAGGAWMISAKWFVRGLGIISTLILVRFIPPESYGLVAMATVFFGLLRTMGDFGFDAALIYTRNTESWSYDTAWTLNFAIGLLQAGILCLLAVPIAGFFNEPKLEPVVYVLAIGFVINGMRNARTVDFRRNLEFNKEFIYLSSQKLFSFAITVPLAIVLRNHWALIIGIVMGKAGECLLGYLMAPHRVRFSLRGYRQLVSFSKWVYFTRLFKFFSSRSPELILGRVAGSSSLGVYVVAAQLASVATYELVTPINRALFPAFSTISDNLSALRKTYLEVSSMLSLVVVPAGVGIAAVADTLVPLALGPRWMATIPIIQLVGTAGAIRGTLTAAGPVFLSLGRPHLQTYIAALWLVVFFPLAYVLGKEDGGVGLATAFLCAEILIFPVRLGFVLYQLELPLLHWLRFEFRPIAATACMFVALYWLQGQVNVSLEQGAAMLALVLLGQVLAGVVVYVASLAVLLALAGFPSGAETRIVRMIASRLPARAA